MRWEYKVVDLSPDVDDHTDMALRTNEQLLNDLGKDGWELVAVAAYTYSHYGGNYTESTVAHLKRALPES